MDLMCFLIARENMSTSWLFLEHENIYKIFFILCLHKIVQKTYLD